MGTGEELGERPRGLVSEWQVVGLLDDHPDLTQRAAKRGSDLRMDAYARRELGAPGLRQERRAHERDEGELPGLGADVR